MHPLNALYDFVARAIVVIHGGVENVVGDNGYAWALSIIILVAAVRLVLFPLFVKQIKSQRSMQAMQPKVKEIKEKYKNDKKKQQEMLVALQKEHGNPLLGCLPIVVQIPLFLSLFRVMNGFAPVAQSKVDKVTALLVSPGQYYQPLHGNGLSIQQAYQIAHAKIFGASISTSFTSSSKTLHLLGSDGTTTKILCVILILIMMGSTYVTQRQIMGRSPAGDSTQASTQKIMLYLSPLVLGVFGFRFSIGVLLYWFTTNVWSMGQQYVVIRRMPPQIGGAAATPGGGAAPGGSTVPALSGPKKPATGGAAPFLRSKRSPEPVVETAAPQRLVQRRDAPTAENRPPGKPQQRKKNNRRGGRR